MGIYLRKERRTNDHVYYWLVTSYRKDGKVHQKKLMYFGKKEPISEEVESAKLLFLPKVNDLKKSKFNKNHKKNPPNKHRSEVKIDCSDSHTKQNSNSPRVR
jgi:hypothetical protein